MTFDLELVTLHTPLFLGGVNWGDKLLKKTSKGTLELTYNQTEKELWVKFGKFTAIVPNSNVASMTITGMPTMRNESHPMVAHIHEAQVGAPTSSVQNEVVVPKSPGKKPKTTIISTAQAGTPHDHVFGGEGKGRAHD